MKELDNVNILLNAITPIIIICFFLLDSMLYRNLKGIVFLIGLSISIITTVLVSNTINIPQPLSDKTQCIPFTFNSSPASIKFPLTPNIIIFTITSLAITMLHNNFILANIGFIFTMLSIFTVNIIWLLEQKCFSVLHISIATMVGLITAILWSYILNKSNNKQYLYNLGVSSNDTCQIPKRKTFKCKTK